MSLLTRKGTIVRSNRSSLRSSRRSSRRSRSSSTGSISASFKKSHSEDSGAGARLKSPIRSHASPMSSLTETVVFCLILSSYISLETSFQDVSNDMSHDRIGQERNEIFQTEESFDDERKLVRTSVGWDGRHGDDLQPEYGAFMYQINEASKEAENICDFVCKTSNILCNTIFVTVLVGLSMALPVAMVSVGVKYLDDCPKEPRVPVYLLVGGCFGMIKLMSTLWRNIQSRRYQDVEAVFDDHDTDGAFASTTYRTMDMILLLFLIGWQIAGTYWTLDIWTPHFHQLLHEPSNWCDQTVYMFSIYQIFGCYGLMALYVLVLFTIMCCQKCTRTF